MVVFLVLHARYKDVQWGIFRNETLIESAADESKKVSKYFLTMLGNLLQKHELSLSDLSFIAAHKGPAPLTTLRVSLATINGFSFAENIPLLGVHGLEALLNEHSQPNKVTIALLNAFGQELYYAIDDPFWQNRTDTAPTERSILSGESASRRYGRAKAVDVLQQLAHHYTEPLFLVGNGVELYADLLKTYLRDRAHPLSHDIASLEAIAHTALTQWYQGKREQEIVPVYFKEALLLY